MRALTLCVFVVHLIHIFHAAQNTFTTQVCEQEKVVLGCTRPNERIFIKTAFYGRKARQTFQCQSGMVDRKIFENRDCTADSREVLRVLKAKARHETRKCETDAFSWLLTRSMIEDVDKNVTKRLKAKNVVPRYENCLLESITKMKKNETIAFVLIEYKCRKQKSFDCKTTGQWTTTTLGNKNTNPKKLITTTQLETTTSQTSSSSSVITTQDSKTTSTQASGSTMTRSKIICKGKFVYKNVSTRLIVYMRYFPGVYEEKCTKIKLFISGKIKFECTRNGTIKNIDFSGCRSRDVMEFENYAKQGVLPALNKLQVINNKNKKSGGEMTSSDVRSMSGSLNSLLKNDTGDAFGSISVNETKKKNQVVLNAGVNMLKSKTAWKEMKLAEKKETSASLLGALEGLGRQVGKRLLMERSVSSLKSNLSSKLIEQRIVKPVSVSGGMKTRVDMADGSVDVKLSSSSSPAAVVVTSVRNMDAYLQPAANDSNFANLTVYSSVMSVVVAGDESSQISVLLSLKLLNPVNTSTNRRCAWLQLSTGVWSDDGCTWLKEKSSANSTVCRCSHLTNFAVLMDFDGRLTDFLQENQSHNKILQVLTITGCVIAVICLSLALLTFIVIKGARSGARDTLHKNVCLCLLVGEVLFMVSMCGPQSLGKLGCAVLAGLLHYVFLSAFMWMLCEGIELWFMVVKVFETVTRTKIYYPVAYGVPMVIVAISAGVFPQGYGTNQVCWLTPERGFMFAFVGPVCAVLIVNLVMFAITIRVIHVTGAKSPMDGKHQSQNHSQVRTWIKTSLILVILLGLTWILGLVKFGKTSTTADLVMAYVFVVVNTLQGAFFFLVHVLAHEKVRSDWVATLLRQTWLPEGLRDCLRRRRYQMHAPTASSEKGGSAAESRKKNHTWGFTNFFMNRRSSKTPSSSLTPLGATSSLKNKLVVQPGSPGVQQVESPPLPPPSDTTGRPASTMEETRALLTRGRPESSLDSGPDSGYLDGYNSELPTSDFRSEVGDAELFRLSGTAVDELPSVCPIPAPGSTGGDGYLVPRDNVRLDSVLEDEGKDGYLVPVFSIPKSSLDVTWYPETV